jgi:hypothetical protein
VAGIVGGAAAVSVDSGERRGTPMFPCLGVYTLDGRVIGAYGRIAPIPLIDGRAADAAVPAA